MSWQRITLTIDGKDVDALTAALLARGALAVDASDADAGTPAEQPAYAEPGSASAFWPRNALSVLFHPSADVAEALADAFRTAGVEPVAWSREQLPDRDWVRLTQAQFEPVRISARLWIVPSWEKAPDPRAINITLDPGVAFGTGTHPTTRLCLEWLDENIRGGESVLDYGCGSGILAIAAARLGAGRVRGIDIDPQAVVAARANAMQNRVAAEFHEPGNERQSAFDVVLANILAGPLVALTPLIARATRPQGSVVLCGILDAQAEEVARAYAPWFDMSAPRVDDGWALLAGRRSRSMP